MAGITSYCFLEDDLGQFPLPVIKPRQMGGQGSSSNTNRATLQIHLGHLSLFRWKNGGRERNLMNTGYQLMFSGY